MNKLKKKWVIGLGLGLALVLLVIGLSVYSASDSESQEASAVPEYVKLSGDLDGLTKEQIKLIEANVIPQASDLFQYTEARVYNDKRAGHVISFTVTNESFGFAYGEYYEPTFSHSQATAIEMIHENIKIASVKLDAIIKQTDGVAMEFKLPRMESKLIMKVRGGRVIKTVFEGEE